jgi:hypothetical protein
MRMRSKLTRLGVVATGLLGLLSTTAPPAHSATVMTAAFEATVVLDGPLDYPCNPTVPGLPCPPPAPTLVTDLPLPGEISPTFTNFHLDYGHNLRNIAGIAPVLCTDAAANVLKDKAPTHEGDCGFSNPIPKEPVPSGNQNTVSGYCGLSGGQVTVNFTDALGQTFYVDLHFTGEATTLTFTGHARKRADGQTGKVVGEGVAVPLPDVLVPPSGNSCLSKTATRFTVVGTVTAETT